MKILHLIDSGGFYGAEAMILALSMEQIEQGDNPLIVDIISRGDDEAELVKRARREGVESISLELSGGYYNQAKIILQFIENNKIDVLHTHGYKPSILIALLGGRLHVPRIRTVHGWTFVSIFSKMFFYAFIDAISMLWQDKVVVVNVDMLSFKMLKWLPSSKMDFIANGIPTASPKYISLDDLADDNWKKLADDRFIIGSIGRLSIEKSQKDLLYVVSSLINKGYSVGLIIIGEGKERKNLEELADLLGIKDYVYLPGYKEDASRYLKLFNLFVLCSKTEGLPITVLESMRAEVPIVSTNVGAMPQLLRDNRGFLVEPGNSIALEKACQNCLDNPEIGSLAASNAYTYFQAGFSSRVMAERYKQQYERAIEHRQVRAL